MTDTTHQRVYTGIGSRATPPDILQQMTALAAQLADAGWVLRSGAGAGADQAFERGAVEAGGSTVIFLPWTSFNEHASPLCDPPAEAFEIAATVHPAWTRLSDRARRLHARNVHQVLGADLHSPSTFVVCWTPDGAESEAQVSRETGGTATAIVVASRCGVPVLNLARDGRADHCLAFALN